MAIVIPVIFFNINSLFYSQLLNKPKTITRARVFCEGLIKQRLQSDTKYILNKTFKIHFKNEFIN